MMDAPLASGGPSLSEAECVALRSHWTLDPEVAFLNHGSFGACPASVLAEQQALRARMERDPCRFMIDELEPLLDAAREEVAAFLGASAENLVFVPNATVGVNAVVRSLDLGPGDELLTIDHAYNACANVLRFAAERAGARVAVASAPIPVGGPDEIMHAVLGAMTPRTRLVMIDAITSPTAIVLPFGALIREVQSRGVDVLLDAAHAAGMIDLQLDALGPAYATGNFHKWTCAPKGSGFLYVRPDRQGRVRPVAISHGANSTRGDRTRFHLEFDWTGTQDFTPFLCTPAAIRAVGGMLLGGWPAVRERNRAMVLVARRRMIETLGITPVAPESMIGSIASFMLPDADPGAAPVTGNDHLHFRLQNEARVQVPVMPWPSPPHRLIRISAHLHNRRSDYERLIAALRSLLPGLGPR